METKQYALPFDVYSAGYYERLSDGFWSTLPEASKEDVFAHWLKPLNHPKLAGWKTCRSVAEESALSAIREAFGDVGLLHRKGLVRAHLRLNESVKDCPLIAFGILLLSNLRSDDPHPDLQFGTYTNLHDIPIQLTASSISTCFVAMHPNTTQIALTLFHTPPANLK